MRKLFKCFSGFIEIHCPTSIWLVHYLHHGWLSRGCRVALPLSGPPVSNCLIVDLVAYGVGLALKAPVVVAESQAVVFGLAGFIAVGDELGGEGGGHLAHALATHHAAATALGCDSGNHGEGEKSECSCVHVDSLRL